MLSADGKCFAFDKRANGMVPGEAVAVVVLKRLSRAEEDGDPIYATILGSGINYDGKTNGITAPSGIAQRDLLQSVYDQYQINPEGIEYIVTHGTGTKLGDPVEINALFDAFKKYTNKQNFCALTSTKTNFGHTFAASGLLSIISLVQALRHETIPASLHCEQENDYISWKESPFYVNKSSRLWPERPGKDRIGAVSAFGMSGTNAHMVLQDYSSEKERDSEHAPYFLLALSAKTKGALQEKVKDMVRFLENQNGLGQDLSQISYTLLEGRHHFQYRCVIVIQDKEDAIYAWNQLEGKEKILNVFQGCVAREFTGQKAIQRYANDLLKQSRSARENKDQYQEILLALANLYCEGYEIPWSKLYGESKPQRVSLPTYPFVQERYWIPESPSLPSNHKSEIINHKSLWLHPLLHENTSDLSEQRFSSTFTGAEFFLKDHQVKGEKVLPGVAYLEMARKAIHQASGAFSRESQGIQLKNVVWARTIAVNAPQEVHIGLFPEENGAISYDIYTDTPNQEEEPIAHCQGIATVVNSERTAPLDLGDLQAKLKQNSFSSQACYKAFKGNGIDYGPAHQGLEKIYVGDNEVLAKLTLPASVSKTKDQFILHPSILDSALQASIGIGLGKEAQNGELRPSLPFALEHLEILGSCSESMWAWVRLVRDPRLTGNTKAMAQMLDIDLCDESGLICVKMRGFTSRVLEREIAGKNEAFGTLMCQPIWKVKMVPKNVNPTENSQHLVLLCKTDLLNVESRGLEENRADVAWVWLQSEGKDLATRYQDISIQAFETIKNILEKKPKGKILIQILIPLEGKEQLFHGLSGLLKTANLENPNILGQVIEVDPSESEQGLLTKIHENSRCPEDAQIRYRKGQRQMAGWEEVPSSVGAARVPWKDGGIYLITGGAGGLGIIFAREIVSKTKDTTLILTGRSRLSQEKQEQLKALESLGTRIDYRQVDVSEQKEVEDLIQSIGREFGQLHGILHGAGVIHDNFILKKTLKEVTEVMKPKVAGVVNLDQAGKELALDFFILFSSVVSPFGNTGQADYSTANAFLDAYAHYRNTLVHDGQRHGWTLSINWPLWKDGGMQVDEATEKMMLQTTGIIPLQSSRGIQFLYDGLACGHEQVMVMAGNVGRIRKKLILSGRHTEGEQPEGASPPITGKEPPSAGESTVEIDISGLRAKVQEALLQIVSQLLKIKTEDLDSDSELSEYGFDSVMLTEFANILNERYKLELIPTLFFEHPTLGSFAEYLIDNHHSVFTPRLEVPSSSDTSPPSVEKDGEKIHSTRRGRSRFARKAVLTPSISFPNAPDSVAIVGMSGCFPMAKDVDELWRNLVEGKNCITEIPRDRWNWESIYGDPQAEANKTNIKWGGFIDGIGEFDSLFFGISPREAQFMDPQQRLLMIYVWSAIEDAGYSAKSISGSKTAIFVGTGSSGYNGLIFQADVAIEGYSPTGMVPSVGPNRMSYFLNVHGPSEPIETACSSSLVALHRAVVCIRNGNCEMAIAGGVNTIITPDGHIGFSKAGMLCEDGRCKTFSSQANGYVRGEGVGMLLLKRLKAAEEAKDHIYGVIRATAENHGGRANSLTAPNPKAQSDLLITAYKKASIDPRTVSYIEAHGTGTELGDPIEINGLKTAFAELYQATGDSKVVSSHCGLGSVKTNIGHLELAAGIAGVIKVLLQLKHKTLVKSLHCDEINPYIQLKGSPFYIVQKTQDWKTVNDSHGNDLPRRAGVSSFGFGGANAHVVIEEYVDKGSGFGVQGSRSANEGSPAEQDSKLENTGPYLIVLSAKNEERLKEAAKNLYSFLTLNRESRSAGLPSLALREPETVNLRDFAYTLQVGREAMEERAAMIVRSLEELEEKLKGIVEDQDDIEDLYRGQVTRNKDALAVLTGDEEFQETLDKWLRRRKHAKLLDLWVKGLNFDWNKFYNDSKPRRISLPTYPFARERYWIGASREARQNQKSYTDIQGKRANNSFNVSRVMDTSSSQKITLRDQNLELTKFPVGKTTAIAKKIELCSLSEIKKRLYFEGTVLSNREILHTLSIPNTILLREHTVFGYHVLPTDSLIEMVYQGAVRYFKSSELSFQNVFIINPDCQLGKLVDSNQFVI